MADNFNIGDVGGAYDFPSPSITATGSTPRPMSFVQPFVLTVNGATYVTSTNDGLFLDCTSGESPLPLGSSNSGATAFSFENLLGVITADYKFGAEWCANLVSFELPSLEIMHSKLYIYGCTSLTTTDFSSLKAIGDGLDFQDNTSATTVSFSALQAVGRAVAITGNTLLASIDLSAIKYIGGDFTATGNALTQAAVNNILVWLAALDGTNGTTSYDNKTIDLSGGTNAAPSGAGLTAKTTLQNRGCTVTTNP